MRNMCQCLHNNVFFFGCMSNKSLELVDLGQRLFLGYGVLVCEEEA